MQLNNNLFLILYEQMLLESLWDTDETSQQLDVPTTGGFAEDMVKTYELYYKWYELTTKPFSGVPIRKQNILKQLQPELLRAMNNVSGVLLHVFGEWLKSHAITNPRQWAIARLDDAAKSSGYDSFNDINDDETNASALTGIIYEWWNYTNKKQYSYGAGPSENAIRSMFFNTAVKNINNLPIFKESIINKLIELEKENREYQLTSDGEEEYKRMYGLGENENAEDHVTNVQAEDIDVGEMIWTYYPESENIIDLIGRDNFADVLIELNEKLVFPVWYDKWQAEGIDTTRERVETAYRTLKNSGPEDINKYSASLNIALNTAHQTGSMLDHVDNYLSQNEENEVDIKNLLDQLSDPPPNVIARWDKELKENGVEI